MANLVADHSEDPAVRGLAFDIATTQTNQVGRMQGWLALWGYSPTGGDADGVDGRRHARHGSMPAAPASCPEWRPRTSWRNLRSLTGSAFDVEFLRLMIRHHEGGLRHGAVRGRARAETDVVRSLAKSIADTQTAETELMTGMLAAAGRHTPARTLRPAVGARPEADSVSPATRTSPRSSGDRALPSGGRGAGSNPAGGTHRHTGSAGQHPAFDRQRRAGDVAAGVADQEDQRRGQLVAGRPCGRPAPGSSASRGSPRGSCRSSPRRRSRARAR